MRDKIRRFGAVQRYFIDTGFATFLIRVMGILFIRHDHSFINLICPIIWIEIKMKIFIHISYDIIIDTIFGVDIEHDLETGTFL